MLKKDPRNVLTSGCYGEHRKKQKLKTACINTFEKLFEYRTKRCDSNMWHETLKWLKIMYVKLNNNNIKTEAFIEKLLNGAEPQIFIWPWLFLWENDSAKQNSRSLLGFC